MRQAGAVVISSMLMLLGPIVTGGVAQADTGPRSAFGKEATTVAHWGGCKNIRTRSGASKFTHRGLVCDLRGHRVNIITFTNKNQEIAWAATVCTFFPKQWVMLGPGFIVTAKDGNRAAAVAGRNVYHYKAYLCSLIGE